MWKRIREIKRKKSSNTVHHVSVNDRDITSHCVIANKLADTFSHNSSSVRQQAILYGRLQDALRRVHGTSTGPHEIHYQHYLKSAQLIFYF